MMTNRFTLDVLRSVYGEKQTLGSFTLLDNNNPIFSGYTLELPWKENERRISCIPVGEYTAIKHKSPKFGWTFWLQDVPDRSEVLVHKLNYYTQTQGCIGLGQKVVDINGDSVLDITNSAKTVGTVLDLVEDETITIYIHD